MHTRNNARTYFLYMYVIMYEMLYAYPFLRTKQTRTAYMLANHIHTCSCSVFALLSCVVYGKGLSIPTLREFLEAFPSQRINLEIKEKSHLSSEILLTILKEFDEEHKELPPLRERIVVNSRCVLIHIKTLIVVIIIVIIISIIIIYYYYCYYYCYYYHHHHLSLMLAIVCLQLVLFSAPFS